MKPIFFNTEMVRALLDWRKTVTRRAVKGIPSEYFFRGMEMNPAKIAMNADGEIYPKTVKGLYACFKYEDFQMVKTPYQPGDILWVKETWARGYIYNIGTEFYNEDRFEENYTEPDPHSFLDAMTKYYYRADFSARDEYELGMKWRPSIHMPRKAARIFLRVTDVWVERLQNITMTGMAAEGVIQKTVTSGQFQQWKEDYMRPAWDSDVKPKDRGLYGWEANPWVWVISFEQISREEADNNEQHKC